MEKQGCLVPRATRATQASKALLAPEDLKVCLCVFVLLAPEAFKACLLSYSSFSLSVFITMLSGVPGAQGAKGNVGARGFDGARGPEGPSVRALTLNSIPVFMRWMTPLFAGCAWARGRARS